MANSKYTKRAQDSLDILVVADVFMANVKKSCKAAVAHSISQKISNFKKVKSSLEAQLKGMTAKMSGGFFAWIKYRSAVRELKNKMAEVNRNLVAWINSTYKYFFAAPI